MTGHRNRRDPIEMTSERVKLTAIVCLTAIVVVCLLRGIDHAIVATVAAIIGGIAGYEVKKHPGPLGKSNKKLTSN